VAQPGMVEQYTFESDECDVPKTVTKEEVAEIAAEFMATFLGIRSALWRSKRFGRVRCRSGWSRPHTRPED
jgi:hypothetical protein